MYFLALATDYDGTLAHDGIVDPESIEALHRLKQSGRRVILVTGRELADLQRVFPELELCDLAVVENGAVLYNPTTGRETPVANPPPEALVKRLQELRVQPLSIGRRIVATWEPMETVVLEAIRELGLELQITFNKGAVMVLPAGINKASGLGAALGELGLSRHNVVGVGDAENDHAFLSICGCSVAVANALDAVKDTADLTTAGARGKGVIELIDDLMATDLCHVVEHSTRHRVTIGTDKSGPQHRRFL
jgi:HAD superfamily hydrolase (TIGR01484 family)